MGEEGGEILPGMGWQLSAVPPSDTQTNTFSILTPRRLRSDVLSHAGVQEMGC